MNTHAPLTLTMIATLGLVSAACSTRTAIGDLGDSGVLTNPTGTTGAGGLGGTVGVTVGEGGVAGGAGIAAPAGPYAPSGDQVVNDQPFTNPNGISGDWVGYIENGTPGSEEVLLHFATDASGQTTLSVKRGTAALPAPPTDGLKAWPAGTSYALGTAGTGGGYPPQTPMLGFISGAHGVTWTAARLRFRTFDYEPWGPWCDLQTPYPTDDQGDYNCMRPDESDCTHGGGCVLLGLNGDVNHWMMCNDGFCSCNTTGCGFNIGPATLYDITFFGDHAIGAVQNVDGYNAHSLILMPAAAP
jgi:hypothetical protein